MKRGCMIALTDGHPTTVFAGEELRRAFQAMDAALRVDLLEAQRYETSWTGVIWVGVDPAFSELVPAVPDPEADDAVYVRMENGSGIITGSNRRSVLIAVYRCLREMGWGFVRPGRDQERIPAADPMARTVHVAEAASYRHRAVCIEGSCSYEHVLDMVDWLPKAAMNGYFFQFDLPYTFFHNWYGGPAANAAQSMGAGAGGGHGPAIGGRDP